MKTFLKVMGYGFAGLTCAVFVFWFGWLRAPDPQDVCSNLSRIQEKEAGQPYSDDLIKRCVDRMQPPDSGVVPYVRQMKCVRDADSSAQLADCRED